MYTNPFKKEGKGSGLHLQQCKAQQKLQPRGQKFRHKTVPIYSQLLFLHRLH